MFNHIPVSYYPSLLNSITFAGHDKFSADLQEFRIRIHRSYCHFLDKYSDLILSKASDSHIPLDEGRRTLCCILIAKIETHSFDITVGSAQNLPDNHPVSPTAYEIFNLACETLEEKNNNILCDKVLKIQQILESKTQPTGTGLFSSIMLGQTPATTMSLYKQLLEHIKDFEENRTALLMAESASALKAEAEKAETETSIKHQSPSLTRRHSDENQGL
jgi:hypothetical protein